MSIFGRFFRVMTFGESHSPNVGCVIEGFPSNFKVSLQQIQMHLNRRRPGQSILTTARDQSDQVTCVSGLQNGSTLGSPLCFIVGNKNTNKKDYQKFSNIPRPGHADFTYLKKYGIKAESGGGRSSARETIGRVIAGALAQQFLATQGIQFCSYVNQISHIKIPNQINKALIERKITMEQIERSGEVYELRDGRLAHAVKRENSDSELILKIISEDSQRQQFIDLRKEIINSVSNLRCPHLQSSVQMYSKILQAKKNFDSLGGIIQGCIYGLPVGLGEPVFDKLPALMSHAMLSLPASKGFEYGSGFDCVTMTGSQHNDLFNSDLTLKTNNAGGTLGGISNGQTFNYRVAFKPVSSIAQPQQTYDFQGNPVILEAKGRHDPCVLPRVPPITDNVAAMVIMDLFLGKKVHED